MSKRARRWDVDLIGVLATEEEAYDYIGRSRAIFRNSQNALQFYIKALNEQPPHSMPREARLFTCYSSDLERYGFQDDEMNFNLEERINNLRDFLHDTLFIFQPSVRVLATHEEVYVAEEIRLVSKQDSFKTEHTFMAVPVFSKEVHDMSIEDFEANLLGRKFLGRINNISTEQEDTPRIVLWKDNEFTYHMYGPFDEHDYAHAGLLLTADQPVRKGSFEWLDKAYYLGNRDDTVLFIDTQTYESMMEELEKQKPLEQIIREEAYGNDGEPSPIAEEPGATASPSASAATSAAASATAAGKAVKGSQDLAAAQAVSEADRQTKEEEFLDQLMQEARDMGLVYDESDLINFHTAVKSNALTILAGMSGTGKSKLVQAYVKALGLDSNQQVMIPVRPSWTDDSDLLGYVDIKNMIYRPGDSGLIDALIQAQHQDNRKLYVICFEEMNLARVEHYFSQFLSVLEMEPSRRKLQLYSKNMEHQVYNSTTYGPEVQIGNNVIFIGTVNLDESTYHFSDKVLDRANVISLKVKPFSELKKLERKGQKPLNQPKQPISYEDYQQFRKPEELGVSLSDQELNFLWDMHTKMNEENRNLGIGPRVVKQIDYYLRNLPANQYLDRREAFDLQIVQRVLTKIRGPEGMLKDLVGKLSGDKLTGSLYTLLEENSEVSDFTHSKMVMVQKAKELRDNGFTI